MQSRYVGGTLRLLLLKGLLLVPAFTLPAAFAAAPPADVGVGAFKGPRLKRVRAVYAPDAVARGRSGWVVLNFMVSSRGKPYAASVAASSGSKDLESAALYELNHSSFVPASLNGMALDSGDEMRFEFNFSGQQAQISRTFYAGYESLLRAIRKKDADAARHALAALNPERMCEDAYYAIGRARFADVWGTPTKAYWALNRAILDDYHVSCLPKDQSSQLRTLSLELEINLHRYGDALETWKRIKASLPADVKARLTPAIARIRQIGQAHLRYSLSDEIGATAWVVKLFEPQFSISVSRGKISEVRLYCERGYLNFPFNPKLAYNVHGKYGTCTLALVGDPGTRFTLYQF